MSKLTVKLNVNDVEYIVDVKPYWSLLYVLREKLGLSGVKYGCGGGECGACTVLINGKPMLSCMTLAIDAQHKDILTIEGLADPVTGRLHPIQRAFVEHSGMQCGVCTPGMILTAKALLDEKPDPTEEDVRSALSGNLCRCGNYRRITECVLDAATKMRTGEKDDK